MEYYYENIRFIILICELIFFVVLLPTLIMYLYKHYKGETNFKEVILSNLIKHKLGSAIIIIISIISIINVFCVLLYSNTNIGSFYEKDKYFEDFYIFVSTEPFEKSKHIRKVPATIHSVRGGLENNSYYINSLEINGNKVDIEPAEEIYLNFDTEIHDIEDNRYYVQLTKNKVY